MEPLVSVRNLHVSFRLDKHTTFEAVKGISFDIPKDSTMALVGESGSGKSVTSLAILGLLPVGLGLVMYSMNREYMNVLLHDGFGQTLLIGAGLLAGVGFWWMKKTIEIDI